MTIWTHSNWQHKCWYLSRTWSESRHHLNVHFLKPLILKTFTNIFWKPLFEKFLANLFLQLNVHNFPSHFLEICIFVAFTDIVCKPRFWKSLPKFWKVPESDIFVAKKLSSETFWKISFSCYVWKLLSQEWRTAKVESPEWLGSHPWRLTWSLASFRNLSL